MINNLKDYQVFDDNKFTKKDIETEGNTKRFVLNFNPGQILPAHKHPDTYLFFYVVEGNGRLFLDNENHSIKTNDILQCSGNQTLSIENNSKERLSVYVVMTSNN